MNELSIVIPVLNESINLRILIPLILKEVKRYKISKIEVIIIDDNSIDDTFKVINNIQKKNKKIRYYLRDREDKDLSKSCIMGFEKSRYKNILVMDGDLQHNPKYIFKIFNKFKKSKSDIIVGSRDFLKKENKGLGFIRKTFSIILIFFINILLGNKTNDPMSGFFLFKKKIFTENKNNLYGKGYKILADIIYSSKKDLKIIDYTIDFDRRKSGKSKMDIKILFLLINFMITKSILRFVK